MAGTPDTGGNTPEVTTSTAIDRFLASPALAESTRRALELVERYMAVRLRKRELGEGTLVSIVDGAVARSHSFEPDRTFVEDSPLPPVRAPEEARTCLARLAAITASAAGR